MQKDDVIYRQAAIDAVEESRRFNPHNDGKLARLHEYEHRHFLKMLRDLPSAESDVAEKLHQCKCYITDKKGLQHEVIYIDDIRRVTGWEI